MRRDGCVGSVLLGVLLAIGLLGAPANAQTSNSAAKVVTGDVLNIEGETYVIKDITGHEIHLRVNNETKSEDRIKVGDKIVAQVGDDGHAKSIQIQIPTDFSGYGSPVR